MQFSGTKLSWGTGSGKKAETGRGGGGMGKIWTKFCGGLGKSPLGKNPCVPSLKLIRIVSRNS